MAKYINADELKDKIFELANDDYYAPLDDYVDGLRQRTEGILDIVDEMPESIVRCKDCKYYKYNKYYQTYCCCRKPNKYIDDYDKRELADYCSKGKRRESKC